MTSHDYQRQGRCAACFQARRHRAQLDLALDALFVAAIGLGILAMLMAGEVFFGWTMGR